MNSNDIRTWLYSRLGENRGDRGWFVITRVHTDVDWIYQMTSYLNHLVNADGLISMTDEVYQKLGEIGGLNSDDSGVQLRRHHLLVMNKPLQLIEKVNGRFWSELRLTNLGRELAVTNDPKSILDKCLKNIQFAVSPSCPDERAENYSEFNVFVYDAINQVMESCGGYIDRDEYDLFVSRIRAENEISECIDLVQAYRLLSPPNQVKLINVIRNTFTTGEIKVYQNWRDMSLHTFSLFSLGKTMARDNQTLRLINNWCHIDDNISLLNDDEQDNSNIESGLKLPKPETSDFREPPIAPEENNGAGAESFVASAYRSEGWDVHFYTNKRGYGFDLWASKGESAVYIEVKSSVDIVTSVTMTENEYRAAQKYREQYMLVLVDNSGKSNQKLRILEDPYDKLEFTDRTTLSYSAVISS